MEDFGYSVLAEVGNVADAVVVICAKRPDLVILDLALPDGDGFEVMEKAATCCSSTQYLVVSGHCEESTVFRLERSAAAAFVDKSAGSLSAVREAITAISNGLQYFSSNFRQAAVALRLHREAAIRLLTPAELRVLRYIVLGHTDEEIGHAISSSPLTVKTHRSNILHKLEIPNTPKLIAFALQTGLVYPAASPKQQRLLL